MRNVQILCAVGQIVSDIFESLIGAVYLDAERTMGPVWKAMNRLMPIAIDFKAHRVDVNL